MSTITRFEDLEVWQLARLLANKIYQLSQTGDFSKDYKLKDQINGSSGSVMDNIAEGFERKGNREFIQFLSIARGSVGETRSQLYRMLDRKYISESEFDQLIDQTIEITKKLSGLIKYLNGSSMKGTKFIREPFENYGQDETSSDS